MAITKRTVKPPADNPETENPETETQQENEEDEEEQQDLDLTAANQNGEQGEGEENSKSEDDDVEKAEEEEEEEEEGKESEEDEGDDGDGEDEEKSEPKMASQDFKSDSESESEDDESDEETGSEPETVVVKPIASKPMNGGGPKSVPKSNKKRVAEEGGDDDGDDEKVKDMMKKKAKLSNGKGEAVSKSSTKRVWSDEDEVVLLNGLIEFRAKKGEDPKEHMQEFYEFIKGSVEVVNVKKTQITDKVRRLRQKYEAYDEKARRGKKLVFPEPHEEELYEISKKVWGNEAKGEVSKKGSGNEGAVSKKGSENEGAVSIRVGENEGASKREVKKSGASDVGKKVIEDGDFAATYPDLYAELESEDSSLGARLLMKRSLSKIGHAKLKALDEEWKAAHVDEAKLLGKRSELTRKMVLAATE